MANLRKSRKGKYLRNEENQQPVKKHPVPVGFLVTVAVLVVVLIIAVLVQNKPSIYQTLVDSGYTGTQEQWIASLVGEEADHTQTAYEIACSRGYRETETVWIKTLTGAEVSEVSKTPYAVACENGFQGSLVQWLSEIAHRPERLGRSDGTGQITGYEQACSYGFSGTFIEWLVSITQDYS